MLNAFFDEDTYKLYTKHNKSLINKLDIVFVNNYDLKKLVYLDLIKNILLMGPKSISYQNFLKTLENHYDLKYDITNTRVGLSILTRISLTFLNSKYNKIDEIIKILFDTLNNPKIDKEHINLAKQNLFNERLLINDDLTIKNIKNSLFYIDKNIFYSDESYNKILNDITCKSVRDFYNCFLEYTKKYIYFLGDFKSNTVYNSIKKYNIFSSICTNKNDFYLGPLSYKRCKNISKNIKKDYLEVVQVYTYSILSEYEQNYVLPLFNIIMGSSLIDSIIFKKLREEEGLIYGLNTFYRKHDRLLILETSLSKRNYNKGIRLIRNSFKDVKKGKLDKNLLDDAKKLIINNLLSLEDSKDSIINNQIYKTIFKREDLNTRIKEYKKVSIKDIIKISNKIKLIINYRNGEYDE